MRSDDPLTNIRVLKKSRKLPAAGDVFAMRPPDGQYLFGRVIYAGMDDGPMPLSNLIYVYRARAASMDPPRAEMRPDNLLVPPLFTNRMGWTKGVFQCVDNWPIGDDDILDPHCFWDYLGNRYVDERGRPTPANTTQKNGNFTLVSYRHIDDRISEALGIPPAPDDEPGPDAMTQHRT